MEAHCLAVAHPAGAQQVVLAAVEVIEVLGVVMIINCRIHEHITYAYTD